VDCAWRWSGCEAGKTWWRKLAKRWRRERGKTQTTGLHRRRTSAMMPSKSFRSPFASQLFSLVRGGGSNDRKSKLADSTTVDEARSDGRRRNSGKVRSTEVPGGWVFQKPLERKRGGLGGLCLEHNTHGRSGKWRL